MDEVLTLEALVGSLQHLLKTLPNVPRAVGAHHSDDIPFQSSLSHTIPSLPIESSQIPQTPQSQQALVAYLSTHILPHLNGAALSSNYYGLVTGGTTPAALLADWLVSVYDQNVSLHLPSETISTTLEVATLNQLLDLFYFPRSIWGIGDSPSGSGTFTTGATASNILGLATGREWTISHAAQRKGLAPALASVAICGLLKACSTAGITQIKLLSALPHSSVLKAAAILGLGRECFVSIASLSSPTTISLELLEREASDPTAACILVVGVGEVNTGLFATSSLAQWQELRALCDRLGVWIHVDAAFGLFARLLRDQGPEYARLAAGAEGVELADSVTGDAHKLLNVPYDCGFFFTRHKDVAERVFLNSAPYLSTEAKPEVANNADASKSVSTAGKAEEGGGDRDGIQTPLNITLENSRRFRALPVHATLMAYGREGHVDMIKRQVGLARRVVRWLLTEGRTWYEVLPELGGDVEEFIARTYVIVLFRARDGRVNEELVERIKKTGRIYVSGTVWDGKKATRIAVSNWQVNVERDAKLIEEVLREVAQ
jgi:glutamate/tyrosine decarboxylase-like PLP-dependent enzyme